jgi:hypothetical protein
MNKTLVKGRVLILVSQKTLFEFCANPELVGKLNTVCLESLKKIKISISLVKNLPN